MTKKLRTPLIKPRQQGGTFYTFSSALEDIGLNINELNNRVALSHYAVLDIPAFSNTESDSLFNARATGGTYESTTNAGDYIFADGFQNYVLNLETVLRNQDVYNYSKSATVSERVFWKWLENCMALVEDSSNPGYYIDDNEIVKAFGLITTGAQRSDAQGMYNETFVQIPSSFGKMRCYFKTVEDMNCYSGTFGCNTFDSSGNAVIENYSNFDSSVTAYGLSYLASTDVDSSYIIDEPIQLELTLSNLREIYDDDTLTFDDLAIKGLGYDSDETFDYQFNAILLYYSIYDSTGVNILATNAYGILILNNSTADGDGYKFGELQKIKSTNTSVGTSFAFRINIKPTNVYSGEFTIGDDSTASYEMASDFSDMLRSLAASVDILNSNANTLNLISTNYASMKQLVGDMINRLIEVQRSLDAILLGSVRTMNAQSITTSSASIGALNSSTTIYDASSGNTVGSFDASTFTMQNINVIDTLTTNNLHINEIAVDNIKSNSSSGNIQINGAAFNGQNVYLSGDYYGNVQTNATNPILNTALSAIFRNVEVVWNQSASDADLGLILPNARNIDTDYAGLYNALFDNNGNVNITNLLLALLAYIKTIH